MIYGLMYAATAGELGISYEKVNPLLVTPHTRSVPGRAGWHWISVTRRLKCVNLSLVIPCYNEAKTLEACVSRVLNLTSADYRRSLFYGRQPSIARLLATCHSEIVILHHIRTEARVLLFVFSNSKSLPAPFFSCPSGFRFPGGGFDLIKVVMRISHEGKTR